MTLYFHQAYDSQVAYQYLKNRNLQQHQIYTEAGVRPQIVSELVLPLRTYNEEDLQQHAQLYRAEDIQQHTQTYREITQALQTQVSILQPPTVHICNVYSKQCNSERELQSHNANHTSEKAHICKVCHRGFTRKNNLLTHCLTHTGDKPHICPVCNRGFSRKDNLRTHSLIHTGQKPHVCDICNWRFTHEKSLRRHYLTHTGKKNHICEICNKAFARKHHLRSHHLVHSADGEGERQRGEGTGKKDSDDEKTIVGTETVEKQQAEQQSEHAEKEKHCDVKLADKSGSYDQASIHGEKQLFLHNGQALATLDQPFTHMVHQAFNIVPQVLQPLISVYQQCLAQLGPQALAQIRHRGNYCTDWQRNMGCTPVPLYYS